MPATPIAPPVRAGYAASVKTVEEAARHLRCRPEEVAVCSTGVIGVPLPVEKILRALSGIVKNRRPSARSFAEFSLAICTTDTRPKTASASFKMAGKRIHLVGCAKGAGMIHPNMATTLAFVATDANISPSLLQKTLRDVTTRTFNAISIDGDTSTNDTLLVLANGAAEAPAIKSGTSAAPRLCESSRRSLPFTRTANCRRRRRRATRYRN